MAISFEWKEGEWVAREPAQLKFFIPGPGESVMRRGTHRQGRRFAAGVTRGK